MVVDYLKEPQAEPVKKLILDKSIQGHILRRQKMYVIEHLHFLMSKVFTIT